MQFVSLFLSLSISLVCPYAHPNKPNKCPPCLWIGCPKRLSNVMSPQSTATIAWTQCFDWFWGTTMCPPVCVLVSLYMPPLPPPRKKTIHRTPTEKYLIRTNERTNFDEPTNRFPNYVPNSICFPRILSTSLFVINYFLIAVVCPWRGSSLSYLFGHHHHPQWNMRGSWTSSQFPWTHITQIRLTKLSLKHLWKYYNIPFTADCDYWLRLTTYEWWLIVVVHPLEIGIQYERNKITINHRNLINNNFPHIYRSTDERFDERYDGRPTQNHKQSYFMDRCPVPLLLPRIHIIYTHVQPPRLVPHIRTLTFFTPTTTTTATTANPDPCAIHPAYLCHLSVVHLQSTYSAGSLKRTSIPCPCWPTTQTHCTPPSTTVQGHCDRRWLPGPRTVKKVFITTYLFLRFP